MIRDVSHAHANAFEIVRWNLHAQVHQRGRGLPCIRRHTEQRHPSRKRGRAKLEHGCGKLTLTRHDQTRDRNLLHCRHRNREHYIGAIRGCDEQRPRQQAADQIWNGPRE
jgi:hypothetical protein